MTSPTGNVRQLNFPLNRSGDLLSDIPNIPIINELTLQWQTTDPDERIIVTMELSLNEYIALATSVDVGRDIAYGDNSLYIWWLWVRSINSMSICDYVADCIENSESVKNALLANEQQNIGYNSPASNLISNSTSLINPTDCDYDEIWGNAVALWSNINKTNIDALEVLKTETNKLAVLADAISAIPVLGSLPVDEAINFIDQVATWSLENYESALTVELETQITCDLFCLMKENCEFSFEQLFQYFQNYFTEDLSVYTLLQYMTWMTGIAPTGTPIVYLLSMFQLYIAGIAETYLYINSVEFYAISAQLGEPDDDWEILCDCMTVWNHSWLNGDGNPVDDGWVITYGVYNTSPSEQINGTNVSDAKYIELQFTFSGTTTITDISYNVDVKSPNGGNFIIYIRNASNTIIVNDTELVTSASLTNRTLSWNGEQAVDVGWKIVIAGNGRTIANLAENIMKSLTVSGTGDNPFI